LSRIAKGTPGMAIFDELRQADRKAPPKCRDNLPGDKL
jgi:hypothetical protein